MFNETHRKVYNSGELEQTKKAIEKQEWLLIYGGKRKDKQQLAEIAHQFEKHIKHKRRIPFKGDSFHKADLAGCPDNEIYNAFIKELGFFKYTDPRLEPIDDIVSDAKTLFVENLSCKNDYLKREIARLSGQLGIFKDVNQNIGTLVIGLDSIESYNLLPKVFKDIPVNILVKDEPAKSIEDRVEETKKFVFRREGANWLIIYEGVKLPYITDSLGLTYIAFLLYTPGIRIKAFHLFEMANGGVPPEKWSSYRTMNEEDLKREGLSIHKGNNIYRKKGQDYHDDKIDDLSSKSLKEAQDNLEALLANAKEAGDIEEMLSVQGKIDEIIKARADKKRKFQDSKYKNAADAVRKNINKNLDKIKKVSEPLYKHLDTCIDRGDKCLYDPARVNSETINWQP